MAKDYFVFMPFQEEFKDIYEVGIRQACNDERHSVAHTLSPLRGSESFIDAIPGLTPGATNLPPSSMAH